MDLSARSALFPKETRETACSLTLQESSQAKFTFRQKQFGELIFSRKFWDFHIAGTTTRSTVSRNFCTGRLVQGSRSRWKLGSRSSVIDQRYRNAGSDHRIYWLGG